MNFLSKLFSLLLVIVLLSTVFGLGFLGMIPPLSSALGADKPRDLRIEYDSIDLVNARLKSRVKTTSLGFPGYFEKTIQYSGQHFVDTSFTSQELTALANSSEWKYYPVSEVQIRINKDRSLEVSGLLKNSRLGNWLEATGSLDNLTAQILRVLGEGRREIPFYLRVKIAIENYEPDLEFQKIEIGRLSLPAKIITQNQSQLESFVKERMDFVEGLAIKRLQVEGGELRFVGYLPDIERIAID